MFFKCNVVVNYESIEVGGPVKQQCLFPLPPSGLPCQTKWIKKNPLQSIRKKLQRTDTSEMAVWTPPVAISRAWCSATGVSIAAILISCAHSLRREHFPHHSKDTPSGISRLVRIGHWLVKRAQISTCGSQGSIFLAVRVWAVVHF